MAYSVRAKGYMAYMYYMASGALDQCIDGWAMAYGLCFDGWAMPHAVR